MGNQMTQAGEDSFRAFQRKAAEVDAENRKKGNGNGKYGTGPIPEHAEETLALRFAEAHAAELRYVAAWSKWLRWGGARWQHDDTLTAFDMVRHICRAAAAECSRTAAATVAGAKTVAADARPA